ncbi:MAG: hypothetical protein H7122_13140 [Chitinophagaceae bacterium]|nr:hypothetical protein [Chitinophagaceae bacterium]
MKKFQITIQFITDKEFMDLVPAHKTYINYLINKEIVEHYAVSMESQRIWITVNVADRAAIEKIIAQSPLFPYFTYEVHELFALDGQNYRLPTLQMN